MPKEEVQTEDSDLDVGYSLLDIGHSCLWVVGKARDGSDLRPRASVLASRVFCFLDTAVPWAPVRADASRTARGDAPVHSAAVHVRVHEEAMQMDQEELDGYGYEYVYENVSENGYGNENEYGNDESSGQPGDAGDSQSLAPDP